MFGFAANSIGNVPLESATTCLNPVVTSAKTSFVRFFALENNAFGQQLTPSVAVKNRLEALQLALTSKIPVNAQKCVPNVSILATLSTT